VIGALLLGVHTAEVAGGSNTEGWAGSLDGRLGGHGGHLWGEDTGGHCDCDGDFETGSCSMKVLMD